MKENGRKGEIEAERRRKRRLGEIERRFPWKHGRRLSTSYGSRTFGLSQAAIRIFRYMTYAFDSVKSVILGKMAEIYFGILMQTWNNI